MTKILSALNSILWGVPALILIVTVGLYLSLRLGFSQITLFPKAIKEFVSRFRDRSGGFQALCTALAATVGTGNLVGVAGAICLGGPGAVFWMWICGILGMVTKFAEAVLAVRYRVKTVGGFSGGPMNVMEQGLGSRWKPVAKVYCLFGVVASFGIGNAAQINAVITGIHGLVGAESRFGDFLVGALLAVVLGLMLLGGNSRIGAVTQRLVPFAAAGYILLCMGVLIFRANGIPDAFQRIVLGAFSPKAVTGGMLGSAFSALRVGCARGVFTNEAGMGTAGIAHASADVEHPVRQGLMGIMEVFLDTIVICTLTALVILVSGVPIPYGTDVGGELTFHAFSAVYGSAAEVFLTMALVLFAVATVLGWSYYGGRCAEYLFGRKAVRAFMSLQILVIVFAAVMDTAFIWQISETVNGLMVIPNLITLAALSPEVVRLTKEYKKSGGKAVGGGNYADFYQCKPLRALSHAEIPPSGG